MGTIEQTKDIPKSLSETGKIGVRPFPILGYHQVCKFTNRLLPFFFFSI